MQKGEPFDDLSNVADIDLGIVKLGQNVFKVFKQHLGFILMRGRGVVVVLVQHVSEDFAQGLGVDHSIDGDGAQRCELVAHGRIKTLFAGADILQNQAAGFVIDHFK